MVKLILTSEPWPHLETVRDSDSSGRWAKLKRKTERKTNSSSSALFPSLRFSQGTSEFYAGKRVKKKMLEKVKVGGTSPITQKEREEHSEKQEPAALPPAVASDLEVTAMCQ